MTNANLKNKTLKGITNSEDILECECSEDKKFRVVFDVDNTRNYIREFCPNCKNDLKEHSNDQLQQCAFNELSKINRKNISFDSESKSQSNENHTIRGSNIG